MYKDRKYDEVKYVKKVDQTPITLNKSNKFPTYIDIEF